MSTEMTEGLGADADNPEGIIIPEYEVEVAPSAGGAAAGGDSASAKSGADFVFTPELKRKMAVVFAMNAM